MSTTPQQCAAPDADPALPPVPSPVAAPCPSGGGRLRRVVRTAGPLLVGGAVVAIAVMSSSGVASALGRMRRMDGALLAAAVAAEVAVYLCFSLHLRLLAGPGANQRRAAPLRTALVVFGLGSVLPAAPAEGMVIAGAALRRRRLQPRRIAVMLGFSQWFSTRGLLAVAAVDAALAVGLDDVPGPWRGGAIAAAALTAVLLVATTWLSLRRPVAEAVSDAYLWARHPRRPIPRAERRRRGAAWHAVATHVTGTRRQRVALMATAAGAWACDGACMLFALRAAGAHVSPDQLLLAYALGTLASNVPLLPAGIGVVETLAPLLLTHFGVSWADALTAVLVYRLLSTLLPAAAGLVATAGLRVGTPDPVEAPVLALGAGVGALGAGVGALGAPAEPLGAGVA